ncbi:MAG TPA: TVP38/TMEM64 family protein [Spirochaetia bacterium]|nr:TVP38/TMEM64 family protein [Spirochaetia bacterium]
MKKLDFNKFLSLAAFPLLMAALIVPVFIWRHELWDLFSSRRELRTWIQGWGAWAPLVFIGLQTLQVVVFIIPGEVAQILGGFLFGAVKGTILSVAGIFIGSVIAFSLGRVLGRSFVAALFSKERLESVEKLLLTPSARIIFFLLFLIPGLPKDILCYVAGLTPIGFPFFLAASTLGRLPGIVVSAVIGSAAAADRWVLTSIVSVAAVGLFAAGFFLRQPIQRWVERVGSRKHGAGAAAESGAGEAPGAHGAKDSSSSPS